MSSSSLRLCRLLLALNLALLVLLPLVAPVHAAKDEKNRAKDARTKTVSTTDNSTIQKLVQLRTHSIYPPYIDQDLQNRWWDFGGDAYINTNKHIRLTRNRPSQMGWLWSRLPLTATNYVIEAEFKIAGESTHLFGDGMVLWLTKDRAEPGPIFGSKDQFDGLAIVIDTYANSKHKSAFPRILAVMGDGKTSYDLGNDGDKQNLGACSASVRGARVPTKIKLTYIKDSHLDVKLQYKTREDWMNCFRIEGITMPQSPFVGFSALTGDVFDAHDIVSVTTSSAIMYDPSKMQSATNTRGKTGQASGSWFGFLLKLALFVGVCVGALYGYQEYSRRTGFGGRRRGGAPLSEMWSSGKRF